MPTPEFKITPAMLAEAAEKLAEALEVFEQFQAETEATRWSDSTLDEIVETLTTANDQVQDQLLETYVDQRWFTERKWYIENADITIYNETDLPDEEEEDEVDAEESEVNA